MRIVRKRTTIRKRPISEDLEAAGFAKTGECHEPLDDRQVRDILVQLRGTLTPERRSQLEGMLAAMGWFLPPISLEEAAARGLRRRLAKRCVIWRRLLVTTKRIIR
jgi:hypothetical protein